MSLAFGFIFLFIFLQLLFDFANFTYSLNIPCKTLFVRNPCSLVLKSIPDKVESNSENSAPQPNVKSKWELQKESRI